MSFQFCGNQLEKRTCQYDNDAFDYSRKNDDIDNCPDRLFKSQKQHLTPTSQVKCFRASVTTRNVEAVVLCGNPKSEKC